VIRLLVVDDSALMRRLLGRLLQGDEFEVAFARDGVEALAALQSFQPDVVMLDINMPGMDGLACLDRIMIERPTPVIMFSAMTAEGAQQSVEALSLGAVDVLQKPGGAASLELESLAPVLLEKIRAARAARIRQTHRLTDRVRNLAGVAPRGRGRKVGTPSPLPPAGPAAAAQGDGLVLVGCSTGGPPALDSLLAPLPSDFPWPIVVAQHMPATFTGPLARRLDGLCELTVVEVVRAVPLQPGFVYVGRGEADVVVSAKDGALQARPVPPGRGYNWHPSVERLVESAMSTLPAERMVGVLMTGMGNDGAGAMTQLRALGGWTLAEAEETAVVWGMPGELVKAGGAAMVAPLDSLAARLIDRIRP
jgi:two-component system, chemotaxis family, protein-glutamate methylesterase/glutaminase